MTRADLVALQEMERQARGYEHLGLVMFRPEQVFQLLRVVKFLDEENRRLCGDNAELRHELYEIQSGE